MKSVLDTNGNNLGSKREAGGNNLMFTGVSMYVEKFGLYLSTLRAMISLSSDQRGIYEKSEALEAWSGLLPHINSVETTSTCFARGAPTLRRKKSVALRRVD